jgi:hypothetical protein
MSELKVVGRVEDVARFQIGDMVMVHLELRDQIFLDAPHGETGVVTALSYQDTDYHYNLPVVQFGAPTSELRMCNPDYLIILMRQDGSTPEQERVEDAMRKTDVKIKNDAEQEAAKANEAEADDDDDDDDED